MVIATHNVGGRRGTGCVRMGGHQEGYTRPPHPTGEKIALGLEQAETLAGFVSMGAVAKAAPPVTRPSRDQVLSVWACVDVAKAVVVR